MGVTVDRLLQLMVVVALGGAYPLKTLYVVARHEPRAPLRFMFGGKTASGKW
jgi:hypothetical protein